MQIGEFASLCGTKISVLRHYDKEGLLSPDHVDRFTSYRYYAKEQMQTWTKGYVLRKWNRTACAYKIRTIGGRDYLFMEWKSGDYIYGGMDPGHYVFARV